MNRIDTITGFVSEHKDSLGTTIKILSPHHGEPYSVTIPFDSGYDFTLIRGTLEQCQALVNLLAKMEVEL